MQDWERIFDDLAAQGFSLGYSRAIEAFVGEVWIPDASKDGHRSVVRAFSTSGGALPWSRRRSAPGAAG